MIVFSSKNYVFTKSKQPKSRSLKEKLKHEPNITFPTEIKNCHIFTAKRHKGNAFFFWELQRQKQENKSLEKHKSHQSTDALIFLGPKELNLIR